MQTVLKNELIFVFKDLIGDVVKFPIWWYTTGLKKVFIGCVDSVRSVEEKWALRVWIKNVFVPMFGENDWQGRIISFFMRVFQIIARFFIILIWLIVVLIFFIFYLIAPILILSQVLYHWTVVFKFFVEQ